MATPRAESGNVEHGDSAARAAIISISVHDLHPPALRACIESGDGTFELRVAYDESERRERKKESDF